MNWEDLVKQVRDEIEIQPEPWPEFGTKAWFQRYVAEMAEYRKSQISPEKAVDIHKNLAKFDPKFSELAKMAHDTAIALMDYAQNKMENK